jgi:tRNA pseudouridine32 synthase/23S rRNA pseudouridine746 synthase
LSDRHRYVLAEPHIPFELDVLYEDERIIVVDKPHFLASTPRGMWYRETALIRLRERFGEPDITPAHRLDRMTAGVLVFVRDRTCRGAYQMLFQNRQATKIYECLAPCRPIVRPRYGTMTQLEVPRPFPLVRRSHIVKVRGVLGAFEEPGSVNAETLIERGNAVAVRSRRCGQACGSGPDCGGPGGCAGCTGSSGCAGCGDTGFAGCGCAGLGNPASSRQLICRYTLHPRTGKTHQLRVHMNSLGLPIVGDDFYPSIRERSYDDFGQPLALVARTLRFIDPFTSEPREFISRMPL